MSWYPKSLLLQFVRREVIEAFLDAHCKQEAHRMPTTGDANDILTKRVRTHSGYALTQPAPRPHDLPVQRAIRP